MKPSPERAAGLAIVPLITTFGYYILPVYWQSNLYVQFIPQLSAYLALGCWGLSNTDLTCKLGLERHKFQLGFKWGLPTGVALGCLNSFIILSIVPALGGDITFLQHTPHAQIPYWVMMPWFIICIAGVVELNFRGFLLGRLLTLWSITLHTRHLDSKRPRKFWVLFPLLLSAITFSFDPFMVATFGSLHWIAIWDGLIWGWIWIRMTNLYTVIIAHAVEVIILYLAVRATLL